MLQKVETSIRGETGTLLKTKNAKEEWSSLASLLNLFF